MYVQGDGCPASLKTVSGRSQPFLQVEEAWRSSVWGAGQTRCRSHRLLVFVSVMTEDGTVGFVQVGVADDAGGDNAEWETPMGLTQEDLDCVVRVECFSAE